MNKLLITVGLLFCVNVVSKQSVFITELLQNPQKYLGKEVVVHGFVSVQGNDIGLYLTKDYASSYYGRGVGKINVKLNHNNMSLVSDICNAGYIELRGKIVYDYHLATIELTQDSFVFSKKENKIYHCNYYVKNKK